MPDHLNLWIMGGGPSAWALAAACARLGLEVGLVAPDPLAPWPANYGVWANDWREAGLPACLSHEWDRVGVTFDHGHHSVARPYASIHNDALATHLQAQAAGVRVVRGTVANTDGTSVWLDDGTELRGEVVVDATGANSPLLTRKGQSTGAAQTAWGIEAEVEGWDGPVNEAGFMDFSGPTHDVGSFLYTLPRSRTQVFFEETTLAAAPAVSIQELKRRLEARLQRRGITVRTLHSTERCVIPMDPRLPDMNQPVVGFGAAASLVHPATGYTLLHTLKRAPAVAAAIADGLAGKHGSPARARQAAWRSVWPAAARRTNRLHRFGLRTLLTLDDAEQRDFFARFFAMPEERWASYLDPDAPMSDLCVAMLHLFAKADAPLRWRLATAGLGPASPRPNRPAIHGGSA